MSYTLKPYLVDIGVLRSQIGSRDNTLRSVLDKQASTTSQDRSGVTAAVNDLVEGRPLAAGNAACYVFAIELLCRHIGEPLEVDHFNFIRGVFIDDIDEALSCIGFGSRFLRKQLLGRGPPVDIPVPAGPPQCGYLMLQNIEATLSSIQQDLPQGLDWELARGIEELKLWLEHALSRRLDLVCFYF